MDHFEYRKGVLHAEDVPLPDLAEAFGTPLYCMSQATLEHHYRVLDAALEGLERMICFAPKANSSLAVLKVLAAAGAGADVVSEGECRLALAAGIPAGSIVFSGVGKTQAELEFALGAGIGQFNVESEPELEALNGLACARSARAPVALRVNPDVDAGAHAKISTGRAEDKFGIPIESAPEIYARAAALEGIEIVGVDVHIGSQIPNLEPFREAFRKVRALADLLLQAGHAIRGIDLGGGVAALYGDGPDPPEPGAYGGLVREVFGDGAYRLIFEPGRMIAANAGILLSRALHEKRAGGRRILVVDAGMNDLLRPALYGAFHGILPVAEPDTAAVHSPCDVVGPVCETSDTFTRARDLPPIVAGELVVFRTVGAYGAAMASEYNARPRIAEVMVSGAQSALTRPRGTYSEMLSRETVPDWLETGGQVG